MKKKSTLIMLTIILIALSIFQTYGQEYPNGHEYITNITFLPAPLNSADNSLNSAYALPNSLIIDDYNMHFLPSAVSEYGTAYGEIWDSATNPWGGATLKLGPVKLALFLGRPYNGYAGRFLNSTGEFSVANYDTSIAGTGLTGTLNHGIWLQISPVLTPVNHFDIIAGTSLGKIAVGLKFTYSDNSEKNTFELKDVPVKTYDGKLTLNKKVADHHLTFGITLKNFTILKELGIAFDLGLLSFENSIKEDGRKDKAYGDSILKSDNSPLIGALLRPVIMIGDNMLISSINFNIIDTSSLATLKVDSNGDGTLEKDFTENLKDKSTIIGVCAALHTKPIEPLKIIYSLGFDYETRSIEYNKEDKVTPSKDDSKYTETRINFPVGISLEHNTLSWLKTRFGVQKIIFKSVSSKIEDNDYSGTTLNLTGTNETKSARLLSDELITSLGLGVQAAESLTIDLVIGTTSYNFNTIFTRASLKYSY